MTPPGAGYSAGMLADGTLYVSGLQGVDPRTHRLPADFTTEVRTCLDNIGRVLKDAHMSYSNVVSVQIYLVDMSQFGQVDAIYKSYFKRPLSGAHHGGGLQAVLGSPHRNRGGGAGGLDTRSQASLARFPPPRADLGRSRASARSASPTASSTRA